MVRKARDQVGFICNYSNRMAHLRVSLYGMNRVKTVVHQMANLFTLMATLSVLFVTTMYLVTALNLPNQ